MTMDLGADLAVQDAPAPRASEPRPSTRTSPPISFSSRRPAASIAFVTPGDSLMFLFERIVASLDRAFYDEFGTMRVLPPYDVTADSVAAALEDVARSLLSQSVDETDRCQIAARARQAAGAGIAEARTVLTGLDVLAGPTASGVRQVEGRLLAAFD